MKHAASSAASLSYPAPAASPAECRLCHRFDDRLRANHGVAQRCRLGGPVMPDSYDDSPTAIKQLTLNVARSGIVGRFVGKDVKSSMIFAHLLEKEPASGETIDCRAPSDTLKENIRNRVGQVMSYFAIAAGVVTSIWSPIKFQADIGTLLTFMFMSNMICALILAPLFPTSCCVT